MFLTSSNPAHKLIANISSVSRFSRRFVSCVGHRLDCIACLRIAHPCSWEGPFRRHRKEEDGIRPSGRQKQGMHRGWSNAKQWERRRIIITTEWRRETSRIQYKILIYFVNKIFFSTKMRCFFLDSCDDTVQFKSLCVAMAERCQWPKVEVSLHSAQLRLCVLWSFLSKQCRWSCCLHSSESADYLLFGALSILHRNWFPRNISL